MVVDDEPDIVTVTKKGLEIKGFIVDGFTDPQAALGQFKPDYYDLVITDVRMPEMNGFQFYREIRKKDEKVKVAFMTAFDIYEGEFNKIFKNTKVDLFFRKPVGVSELAEQLQQVFNTTLSA